MEASSIYLGESKSKAEKQKRGVDKKHKWISDSRLSYIQVGKLTLYNHWTL